MEPRSIYLIFSTVKKKGIRNKTKKPNKTSRNPPQTKRNKTKKPGKQPTKNFYKLQCSISSGILRSMYK